MKHVVPLYGRSVVPFLIGRLDPSAGRSAARIVEAVAAANARDGARLARQIIDPNAERAFELPAALGGASDEATAAALGALSASRADRALLREALGSKKNPVRLAALARSGKFDEKAVRKTYIEKLGGSMEEAGEAMDALDDARKMLEASAVREALRASGDRLVEALLHGNASPTHATVLSRILRLLSLHHDEADSTVLALASRTFDAGDALRQRNGRSDRIYLHLLGVITVLVIPRLMRHLPDDEAGGVFRRAMIMDAGSVLGQGIARFGPDETWRRLDPASVPKGDLRWSFQETFRRLGERKTPDRYPFQAHPPKSWGPEWIEEGLRQKNIDLVWFLHRRHPKRIVEWARRAKIVSDVDLVMMVLQVDPASAPWLRVKLGSSRRRDARVREPLCRAVEAGDAIACTAVLDELSSHGDFRKVRIAALRRRLARYVGDSRSTGGAS